MDKEITLKFIKRNKESYVKTFKNNKEKTEYIEGFPNKYFWKIEWIK